MSLLPKARVLKRDALFSISKRNGWYVFTSSHSLLFFLFLFKIASDIKNILYIYQPGDVQLPLGAFPLHGASISCTQPPSDRPQPWYTFSVWTCFDHCYPLRCRSERERDLWMSQIGAAIRNEEAPDLDRSDASVLDGTKLDYYQVPEKSNVESSSGVPTRRVSSNGSQAAQEVSNTKRRNLPRVDNDREHTSSQVQSAIKTESAGGVPIIVPAMASVEKPSENAKRIKAQIQYEKARRAKIQVLDEWLCNADLGHLRQK